MKPDYNMLAEMSDEVRQLVGGYLETEYEDMLEGGQTNELLLIGLDQILQVLGVEGHHFT